MYEYVNNIFLYTRYVKNYCQLCSYVQNWVQEFSGTKILKQLLYSNYIIDNLGHS